MPCPNNQLNLSGGEGPKIQDTTEQISVSYIMKVLLGEAAELREIAEKMVAINVTAESGTLVPLSQCGYKESQKYCKTAAKREFAIAQRATE